MVMAPEYRSLTAAPAGLTTRCSEQEIRINRPSWWARGSVAPMDAQGSEELSPGEHAAGRPPPSRRTLTLIVAPIIAVVVVGNLGNLFHAPLLKDHPMWLVAMEPRNRFLLLVADKVSFWPYLVVATARRLVSDPLFYLLGYLYGDRAVRWMERKMGEGGGVVRAIERAFTKAAPVMVFILPGLPVCVLAGATGMNPIVFLVLNVVGTITMVTILYQLAEVLDGPLGAINGFYSDHTLTIFIVTFVLLGLYLVSQQLQGKCDIQSVSKMEAELAGEEPEGRVAEGDEAGGGEAAEEVVAAGSAEGAPPAATKEEQSGGRSGEAESPKHD